MEVAWKIVRELGADALTLGRLAEQAGVTKPVVYSHFESRSMLLAALYREFCSRQMVLTAALFNESPPTLSAKTRVVVDSYVRCVTYQGREIAGVIGALAGSPELEAVQQEFESPFREMCREALAPFAVGGKISDARLHAILSTATALSTAAGAGKLDILEATDELYSTITALVTWSGPVNDSAKLSDV
jgi:AcrR family transcriptional regulator